LLQAYDVGEFENLSSKYNDLKWRIISKPGGATMRQESFYVLYG
jgi:hypothetical protein